MPANQLYIPHILPLTFRAINPVDVEKYVSRPVDKYHFADTIRPVQQPVTWRQPFQQSDTIRLQLKTKYGPLYLNVYNCYGVKIDVQQFTQKQEDKYDPGVFINEVSYPLAALPEGVYYFSLGIGGGNDERYRSEAIDLKARHEGSLCMEYANHIYREGVYFETGIKMEIRLFGSFDYKPASDTVGYQDQNHSVTIINDVYYEVCELFIKPIPHSFKNVVGRVLGCSALSIDGTLYSKGEDSKLEATNDNPRYPLKAYQIDLYKTLNRPYNIYDEEILITQRATMVAAVHTKGFGVSDSDNVVQIENVE